LPHAKLRTRPYPFVPPLNRTLSLASVAARVVVIPLLSLLPRYPRPRVSACAPRMLSALVSRKLPSVPMGNDRKPIRTVSVVPNDVDLNVHVPSKTLPSAVRKFRRVKRARSLRTCRVNVVPRVSLRDPLALVPRIKCVCTAVSRVLPRVCVPRNERANSSLDRTIIPMP